MSIDTKLRPTAEPQDMEDFWASMRRAYAALGDALEQGIEVYYYDSLVVGKLERVAKQLIAVRDMVRPDREALRKGATDG